MRLEKLEINGVTFELIYVEGGAFQMGDNEWANEKPIHVVRVSDFWIGKYPVTQAQWEIIMDSNRSVFKGKNLPVEWVTWHDCQEFLKKLSEKTDKKFKLTTEEEWEYAARGGNKSQNFKYAGSNNIDEVAWYEANSDNKTQEVGTRKPNELGIFDMSGNVWEWTNSGYWENFNAPRSTDVYILRGGSWINDGYGGRVATRNDSYLTYRDDNIGFRLCVGL